MTVTNGMLTSFETGMDWMNQSSSHHHGFLNFVPEEDSIELTTEGDVSIPGEMDVRTNEIITWPSVPAEIVIQKGRIITISLYDGETNNHFGGQSIHGNVTKLCATNAPGPSMQVTQGCL